MRDEIMIRKEIQMPDIRIRLAAVRVNADMTQAEWARAIGVDISTVTNWEQGKSEPKYSHLKKMSRLSGIPMDYIFIPEQS